MMLLDKQPVFWIQYSTCKSMILAWGQSDQLFLWCQCLVQGHYVDRSGGIDLSSQVWNNKALTPSLWDQQQDTISIAIHNQVYINNWNVQIVTKITYI